MSIFEKLNQARLEFQSMGVKKSGKNSYAGYTYYELSDIIPAINKLADKLKFCCIINFTNDLAKLDFCDLEKDERITFTSPMSSASLKGCHEVQNLGAVETYIKRYEKDGLHSINPDYPVMHFRSDESVFLIGRVLGIFSPKGYAKEKDIEKYKHFSKIK